MRMYVKVMAAVIACILLSGEALSAFATTPATENLYPQSRPGHPCRRSLSTSADYQMYRSLPWRIGSYINGKSRSAKTFCGFFTKSTVQNA